VTATPTSAAKEISTNRHPEDQDGAGDDRRRSRAMFRALALRVGLSITLFLCVLLAAKLGYIHPTGWTAGQ
jgi:hypothetical protein